METTDSITHYVDLTLATLVDAIDMLSVWLKSFRI